MFLNLIVNLVTPLLVLNNCYGYYKDKKNKHYKYYFIIFGLFVSIDSLFSYITQFVPFFSFLKLSFIVWLSVPLFNGPSFIYNFYMKKVFSNYENDIDERMENMRKCFVNSVMDKLNEAYGKYKGRNGRLLGTNDKVEEVDQDLGKIGEIQEGLGKIKDMEHDLEKVGEVKEGFGKIEDAKHDLEKDKEAQEVFGKIKDAEHDLEKVGGVQEGFKKEVPDAVNDQINKENIARIDPFASDSREDLEKPIED